MGRAAVPTVSIFCTLFLSVAACDGTPAAPSNADERADQHVQGTTAGTLSLFVPIDSLVPAVDVPITVFASGTQESPVEEGRTDDQGVFTATLEAGTYDVVMTVPDGLFLAPQTRERVYGVAVIANETVDVEGFALSAMRPFARVWGDVGIEGFRPVAGTILTIRKNGAQVQRVSADDGGFDFGVVEPGQWELLIAPPRGRKLDDFVRQLQGIATFGVVYDHPFYAGVFEIGTVREMIRIARAEGFDVCTIQQSLERRRVLSA